MSITLEQALVLMARGKTVANDKNEWYYKLAKIRGNPVSVHLVHSKQFFSELYREWQLTLYWEECYDLPNEGWRALTEAEECDQSQELQ